MKLMFCAACEDLVKLTSHSRTCACKQIKGLYVDKNTVHVSEDAIIIMVNNKEFIKALLNMEKGTGDKPDSESFFEAYVAPYKKCRMVRWLAD